MAVGRFSHADGAGQAEHDHAVLQGLNGQPVDAPRESSGGSIPNRA
jgi:hypothetical protein